MEKKHTEKLTVNMALELPSLPNFLRFKGNEKACFPISEMTDKEIRQLGKEWTEALINRNKKKS